MSGRHVFLLCPRAYSTINRTHLPHMCFVFRQAISRMLMDSCVRHWNSMARTRNVIKLLLSSLSLSLMLVGALLLYSRGPISLAFALFVRSSLISCIILFFLRPFRGCSWIYAQGIGTLWEGRGRVSRSHCSSGECRSKKRCRRANESGGRGNPGVSGRRAIVLACVVWWHDVLHLDSNWRALPLCFLILTEGHFIWATYSYVAVVKNWLVSMLWRINMEFVGYSGSTWHKVTPLGVLSCDSCCMDIFFFEATMLLCGAFIWTVMGINAFVYQTSGKSWPCGSVQILEYSQRCLEYSVSNFLLLNLLKFLHVCFHLISMLMKCWLEAELIQCNAIDIERHGILERHEH